MAMFKDDRAVRKRIGMYCVLFVFFGASGLCAYHTMIDIRPVVQRACLKGGDQQMIDDLEKGLRVHVMMLAEEIGPRNVFVPEALDAAARYIKEFWEEWEYRVQVQEFRVNTVACRNLIAEIPGRSKPEEIIVLGAHYDTVSGSPGANDNGSGVAALLEISRLLRPERPGRTIRFVAFANEEPPLFKTSSMGSLVYSKACRKRRDVIAGMVCLETIGYYIDAEKTQGYPFPLSPFYPDRGNFVAVVGNLRSKSLVTSFSRMFMEETDFPVECGALPGLIPGIDWSDHWSFWRCGYRAVMVTDTALYRYPFYHSAQDTADKVDFRSLARVTSGIGRVISRMAE